MKETNIIWDTENRNLLPTEIEIPDGMSNSDEIEKYISSTTGFCFEGYVLEDE